MRQIAELLRRPHVYTAIAVFVYFSFIGASSPRAESPFGVEDGYCGVDGSCMPMTDWVCNIGGSDHEDKCRTNGGGGCY
jgi:hypothetical protein